MNILTEHGEIDRPDIARIKTNGAVSDLIIECIGSRCGDVRNGISARFDDGQGGFVFDWPSFEAAYLAIRAAYEKQKESM